MAMQVPHLHFAFCGLIVLLSILADAVNSSKQNKRPQLRFNDDGYFKILQLADLHYGHFPETDVHTDKVTK